MQALGGTKGCQGVMGLLLLGLLSGCGGGAARTVERGGPEFPSRADLSAIMRRPAKAEQGQERKTVAVDDWQPAELEQPPTTEAEAVVKRAGDAKGRPLAMDAQLSCTAREVARFFGQHQAFPDQQLQAHMAGVCGVTHPKLGVMVWSTPLDTIADAERQNQWHQGIAQQLGEWLPTAINLAGGAELTEGQNSVFAAAVAAGSVTWEKVGNVVDAQGQIELIGSVRTPAALVYGLGNVGSYGVQDCQSDPRIAPPRFRLVCQLDPGDSSAWLAVQALPPGRVLAHNVARVLLRREGVSLGFTATTKNTAPEVVPGPVDFAKRLFALINETRATARLPALRLALRQSETTARLAPHYFRSDSEVDETADQIALGLLAGWDIQGTIRTGNIFSNSLSGSLDPRRWLAFMLQEPSARRVLLDPLARSIAIGPEVQAQAQTVGAIVSTYAFYESDDHRGDVERFVSRLNQRRAGLGLTPARVLSAPEVAKAVGGVKANHDPAAALQEAMEQMVSRAQQGVEGYYIEANDLDHIVFPEALLRPSVTLAISAAHHRYPQAAWGTLTLLVVLLDSAAQKTATRGKPPG